MDAHLKAMSVIAMGGLHHPPHWAESESTAEIVDELETAIETIMDGTENILEISDNPKSFSYAADVIEAEITEIHKRVSDVKYGIRRVLQLKNVSQMFVNIHQRLKETYGELKQGYLDFLKYRNYDEFDDAAADMQDDCAASIKQLRRLESVLRRA